jgi:hypothetical protein
MPHLGLAILGVPFKGAIGLSLAAGSAANADRKGGGDGDEAEVMGPHHSRGPAAAVGEKCSQYVGGKAGLECGWHLAIFSPF